MALLAISAAKPDFSTLRFLYFSGGIDPYDASAAITSVSGPTTVAYINCPLSVETYDCPYGPGMAYTIISETSFEWTISAEDMYTMTYDCVDRDGKSDKINCGIYAWDGEVATVTDQLRTDLPRTAMQYIEATVTKGAELLTGGSAAPSSTASASEEQPSPSGTTEAPSGTTPPSGTPRSSETDTEAPESTGGAYRPGVEVPLLAVVGGLAAFVA